MSSVRSYPLTAEILPDIPARDLLLQKPSQLWTIEPDATVFQAVELMARASVGALPVIEAGRLCGIVSERDYARKVILVGRSSHATRVDAIMTEEVITIEPNTSIQVCMRLMTSHRIRHLPVLQSGQVVGIVSIGDVVRTTLVQQNLALDELQRYVTGEPRLMRAGRISVG